MKNMFKLGRDEMDVKEMVQNRKIGKTRNGEQKDKVWVLLKFSAYRLEKESKETELS